MTSDLPQGSIPQYEPDEGPLSDEQFAKLKEYAWASLATGKVLAMTSLFGDPGDGMPHMES